MTGWSPSRVRAWSGLPVVRPLWSFSRFPSVLCGLSCGGTVVTHQGREPPLRRATAPSWSRTAHPPQEKPHMPRIEFSQDNKVSSCTDFPKLKLAMGEKARIVCIEEPEAQYTHQLRAPELIGGKPVMEKVKNKDGSTYEKMKLDFIGRPICLGDWDTVLEKGIDAANCPA